MKITITKPTIADCAFVFYFTYSIWFAILNRFLPESVVTVFTVSLMIFIFAIAILESYQMQPMNDVFWVYVIIVALFVLTYIFNSELRYCFWDERWGISRMIAFSSGGIWAYLAVRLIPNYKKLLSNLKIVAYITFIYELYLLIRMLPNGMWHIQNNMGVYYYSQYNMGFGYSMIFVAIVFLCLWYTRKKILDFIIMLVSAACAFIWGSRGAVLCILVAIVLLVLLYLRQKGSNFKKIMIPLLIILLLGFLIYMFSSPILSILNSILGRFGITSRTLLSLLSGSYAQDNGRTQIWTMVFERIKTLFPLGLGAFGDRMIVMPYYAWGYSHNIVLEMTISFGIFGLGFLAWLIYRAIKLILAHADCCIVLIIMLSMSVKLLVSDSFWFYWAFWGLLAICISTFNLKRINSRNGRRTISTSFNR